MPPAIDIRAIEAAAAYLLMAPAADVRLVGDALARWIGGGFETLDEAYGFGLPGHRTAATERDQARMTEFLQMAATRHFESFSARAQAVKIHDAFCDYFRSAWQREKAFEMCPDKRLGTIHEFAWHFLKITDQVPAIETIRKKLVRSSVAVTNFSK